MKTSRGWIVLVVAALVGCGDNLNPVTVDAAPDIGGQTPEERGQYIMNVLAQCNFCHTPLLADGTRDLDKLLSGVDCFADIDSPDFADNMNGFGCISTRNLTNHATGLATRTDAQIKNAFQNGIRTDGKMLAPVMPYWIFHNMTDDDADAIVAYLRTVPGIDHTVKPNEAPWTTYNDAPAPVVTPLVANEIPMPQGGANNASAMRGRYLAGMAGLCIDCHTPENPPFSYNFDTTKFYGGGRVFPKEALGLVGTAFVYPPAIATRNLTPHATGLEGWTKAQIKAAIAEGRDRDNKQVCAATHGGAISPYAALEPQDLDDIVEYVSLLPPVDNDTVADPNVANCGIPPMPQGPPPAETTCTVTGVLLVDDDDNDGVANDGCFESGTDCDNGTDDDGDGVPNDGCPVACGNCQGPLVP